MNYFRILRHNEGLNIFVEFNLLVKYSLLVFFWACENDLTVGPRLLFRLEEWVWFYIFLGLWPGFCAQNPALRLDQKPG